MKTLIITVAIICIGIAGAVQAQNYASCPTQPCEPNLSGPSPFQQYPAAQQAARDMSRDFNQTSQRALGVGVYPQSRTQTVIIINPDGQASYAFGVNEDE